tara:strand:- start:145 stop:309 length:165 start_codon:yes stop_codon:yes gene_type:complete
LPSLLKNIDSSYLVKVDIGKKKNYIYTKGKKFLLPPSIDTSNHAREFGINEAVR